jgi:hypothetical protein
MGLPSYVINFDELVEPIKQAFEMADIKLEIEQIELSDQNLNINTDEIEAMLEQIKVILTNVNGDTTSAKLTAVDILNQLKDHDLKLDIQLDDFQFKLQSMIDTLLDIHELLKAIDGQSVSEGRQKMLGDSIEIIGVPQVTERLFVFDEDILLTGVTVSQSAWNINDQWSIDIGGYTMFDKMYTKMRGEHKQLSKFYPIPAGTEIKFRYDNTASGNSKWVWVDLEFIELIEEEVLEPETPPQPPVVVEDTRDLPSTIEVTSDITVDEREIPGSIDVIRPPMDESVRVHMSGVMIGGSTQVDISGQPSWDIVEVWTEDAVSEIMYEGSYRDAMSVLPKSFASTFDAIAIDDGTRLEVWTETDFGGSKIMNYVGPMIIENDYLRPDIVDTSFENSPHAVQFPPEKRIYVNLDFLEDNFSFKISRVTL